MWRFEVKKVFSRIGNKIVLLVLLAATLVICFQALGNILYVNPDGNVISGVEAARKLRRDKKQWSGELNEELLEKVLADNVSINHSSDNQSPDYRDNNKAEAARQGYYDIKDLLNTAFSPIESYNDSQIDSLTSSDVGKLYDKRISNLREWLDSNDTDRIYSNKEKTFLLEKFSELKTPLYYTDSDGWKTLIQYAPMMMITLTIILGFLVSGIFTNEFQTKADAVFFSTRYGRNKGISAKIYAGIIITTVVFLFTILLYTTIILGVMGWDGAQCYIQTDKDGWFSFYNITYLKAYLIVILGGYIGCLFLLTLAMIISAGTRSALVGVMTPVALLALPTILSGFSALKPFLKLWPDQLFQLSQTIYPYELYSFGGKVVGSVTVILILYIILCICLQPLLFLVYRKTKIR
ncbi:MAG: ABC transporter permease [Eubacterium sp.]